MKKIVTIVAVLAFIVTACAEEPGTVDTPRRIEVDATEMAFDRGSIDVTAGETVEFVVTNSGAVTHEFRVMNQAEIDEHLAAGHEEGHDEEMTDEEMADMEEMVLELEIPSGETKTLTVTFDETDHMARFACLVEGHYEAGMHGDFAFQE